MVLVEVVIPPDSSSDEETKAWDMKRFFFLPLPPEAAVSVAPSSLLGERVRVREREREERE